MSGKPKYKAPIKGVNYGNISDAAQLETASEEMGKAAAAIAKAMGTGKMAHSANAYFGWACTSRDRLANEARRIRESLEMKP